MTPERLTLPPEILELLFRDLDTTDLVSCSHTCWTGNTVANTLLYAQVTIASGRIIKRLNRTLSGEIDEGVSNSRDAEERRKQLGSMIKDFKIEHRFSDSYVEMYQLWHYVKLSHFCPNVHTLSINTELTEAGHFFLHNHLSVLCHIGKQWPCLTDVTFSSINTWDKTKIIDRDVLLRSHTVINRVKTLEVCESPGFFSSLPPRVKSQLTSLRKLKVKVFDRSDFDELLGILCACRETLHTLVVLWDVEDTVKDISPLILESTKLKTFCLEWTSEATFDIDTFGNHLHELELRQEFPNEDCSSRIMDVVGRVLINTTNLRTLRVCTPREPMKDYVEMAAELNKSTLGDLYFNDQLAATSL